MTTSQTGWTCLVIDRTCFVQYTHDERAMKGGCFGKAIQVPRTQECVPNPMTQHSQRRALRTGI